MKLILMILLTATTSAEVINDEDVVMKKGTPAPFYGVLVPEENYRDYSEQWDQNLMLYQKIQTLKTVSECESIKKNERMNWFTTGVILGVLGGGLLVSL